MRRDSALIMKPFSTSKRPRLATLIAGLLLATALPLPAFLFFPIGPVIDANKAATIPQKEATRASDTAAKKAEHTTHTATLTVQSTQQAPAQRRMADAYGMADNFATPNADPDVEARANSTSNLMVQAQAMAPAHNMLENSLSGQQALHTQLDASRIVTQQLREETENARNDTETKKALLRNSGAAEQEILNWLAAKQQKSTAAQIRRLRQGNVKDVTYRNSYVETVDQ